MVELLTPWDLHMPRFASPRLASPRLASPRLASPRLASPRLAYCVAFSVSVVSCGGVAEPEEGATDTQASPVALGAERVIPMRFVRVKAPGDPVVSDADFRVNAERAVATTNDVWRPVGVRFVIKSSKQVDAPLISAQPYLATHYTAALRTELTNILGTAAWPVASVPFDPVATQGHWLNQALITYGDPRDFWVIVSPSSGGSACGSTNRYFYQGEGGLGNNHQMAHELGHCFSLGHTGDERYWLNPETDSVTFTAKQAWDLWYCPGTIGGASHRFFDSYADSMSGGACAEGSRLPITDDNFSNCTGLNGFMTCNIGPPGGRIEAHDHLSPALLGKISFRGLVSYPGSQVRTDYGANIMAYPSANPSSSFSPSQARALRASLRHDVRLVTEPWDGGTNFPTTYLKRPLLGTSNPWIPSDELDVNGDGFRDLAVWSMKPDQIYGNNDATFTVKLGPGFSTGYTRGFGRPDDIPVPAKYDWDNKTDFAVYRPGEGGAGADTDPSTWYICPSNGSSVPPDCSAGGYVGISFGTREDVPLPGLLLGPSQYLAVYRPSTNTVLWRTYSSSTVTSVAVGPAGSKSLSILPGLYDDDAITDFAVWDAAEATFEISLSSLAWSPRRKQVFPSHLKTPTNALGATDLQARSGAIPVHGMVRMSPGSLRRHVPAVFDPAARYLHVSWDPVTALASPFTAPVQSCGTAGADLPLGGLLGTGQTKGMMAWISFGADGTLLRKTPGASLCGTAEPNRTIAGARGHGTAAIVRDLTGDGLPDIVWQDPDNGNIRVLQSSTNPATDFSTSFTVTMGGTFSQML